MAEAVGAKAGTILVVDKQISLLTEIVTTLRDANFVVLEADSEANALHLAARYAGSIDLLLADSELIGMSGLSLPETLSQTRPELQVMLFCGEIVIGYFGCALIQNPFAPAKLVEMINSVLRSAETSQTTQRATSAG